MIHNGFYFLCGKRESACIDITFIQKYYKLPLISPSAIKKNYLAKNKIEKEGLISKVSWKPSLLFFLSLLHWVSFLVILTFIMTTRLNGGGKSGYLKQTDR